MKNGQLIVGLVLALMGIFPAIFPDRFARLRTWMIKDAEPSDLYIIVIRVLGIALILLGLCIAGSSPISLS